MALPVPGSKMPPLRGTFGSSDDDYLKGTRENDTIAGLGGKDTIIGYEGDDWLYGGEGEDYLDGGDQNDHLFGEAGADSLRGGEGDDWLYGGNDDDTLHGGEGADHLNGGAGVDLIYYAGSAAGITIDLTAGTGSGGDADGDKLVSIENVFGTKFDDVLIGDDGANGLRGMAGQDTVTGNGGADTFIFGVSFAGLDGGLGPDADVITDFSQADGDIIDVSGVGKILIYNPVQEIDTLTCTFIGQDPFSGVAGELRFEYAGGNTVVSCDENGDGAADFEIVCLGTINFSVNDFIL